MIFLTGSSWSIRLGWQWCLCACLAGAIFFVSGCAKVAVPNVEGWVGMMRAQLFRSFLWLVSELANVWDSQVELAGSMVGDGSEVDEVFESPGHSLC